MPPKILIVDTDPLTRSSLASWLTRRGCAVDTADHRIEALKLVQGHEVDVILLELGGRGEESLLALKSLKKASPTTEIILLTGPEDIGISIKGMKLGAFDDLLVPVNGELLLSRVQAAFEKRHKIHSRGLLDQTRRSLPKAVKKFMRNVGLGQAEARFVVASVH